MKAGPFPHSEVLVKKLGLLPLVYFLAQKRGKKVGHFMQNCYKNVSGRPFKSEWYVHSGMLEYVTDDDGAMTQIQQKWGTYFQVQATNIAIHLLP